MIDNVIRIDSRRPIADTNPWNGQGECDCSACQIQAIGHDLHNRLGSTEDLISLDAADVMRGFLQRLADMCGVDCQYEQQARR